MKKSEFLSEYRKFEREMAESDRIDSIIEGREKGPFALPKDFDPHLSAEQEVVVSKQHQALKDELERRGFDVILDSGVPLKVKFQYASHVAFITEGLKMPRGQMIFNGCSAWCEDCFQSPWCESRKEIEAEMAMEDAI